MPDTSMIIAMVLSLCFMIASVIFIIVFSICYKRSYVFQLHSHEIVARITIRSVALYVDGRVEDEISAYRMRVCTLRAFVDGEEVKVRMEAVGFRVVVTATAGGRELLLRKISK